MISVQNRGNGELERGEFEGSQEGIGGETGEELGWGMR